MPLIIDLKPGEKVIVNGAVIENAGSSTKLRILNQSKILKQKEIMVEAEVNTPASRVYFCLQCAYIFPEELDKYIELFVKYMDQYLEACPSAAEIAKEIIDDVREGQLYQALKAARKLLKHEQKLFDHMRGVTAD